MKKVALILLFILITTGFVHSQGWFQIWSGPFPYNSVFFIDMNTGWIVSGQAVGQGYYGEILKTTNGGNNWIITYNDNISLSDIFFINNLTGWSTGIRRVNFVSTRHILKTTDGGITFMINHTDTTGYAPINIQFINNNTGFVFTNSNQILKTTNSGINWETNGISTYNIADGLFTSADTGWIAGSFSAVLKTTNSGLNWFPVIQGGKIFWTSISFINNTTGWVTDGFVLRHTSNGGLTWDFLQGGSNRKIKFINNLTGWSYGWYGNAYIRNTTNGGVNWVVQTPLYNDFIFTKLFFITQATGWAVAYRYISPNYYSMILKTTTGGVTYISPVSNELPSEFKLYQNYPNPFNPVTKIRFSIPLNKGGERSTTPGVVRLVEGLSVQLTIYDILGKEVASLINEQLNPGTYEVEFDGTNYPSSVYYYILNFGNLTESKKMILLK